jgi:hypothetical protein
MLVGWHPSLVGLYPIAGDALLRIGQRQFPLTDQFVHHEFQIVFLFCTPFTFAGLRPQVLGIAGTTANVQRNEVVLLVMLGVGVSVAVLAHLLAL